MHDTRITRLTITPAGASIYDELAFHVEIDDEGAGEFIVIKDGDGARISINPDEWPVLRAAVDRMIDEEMRDVPPQ